MYDHIREDILFGMLYAVVAVLSLIACCYLLFRQGNAFARDVTPPVRLRRWTAAYFAAATLCHLWYMPIFFLTSSEDIMMTDLVGGLLDSMTVFPLAIIVMLNMLQIVTTGVSTARAAVGMAGKLFDLQGRRVSQPSRTGVYINNGKKVASK